MLAAALAGVSRDQAGVSREYRLGDMNPRVQTYIRQFYKEQGTVAWSHEAVLFVAVHFYRNLAALELAAKACNWLVKLGAPYRPGRSKHLHCLQ